MSPGPPKLGYRRLVERDVNGRPFTVGFNVDAEGTARVRRVFELAAEGRSTREIGDELGMQPTQVRRVLASTEYRGDKRVPARDRARAVGKGPPPAPGGATAAPVRVIPARCLIPSPRQSRTCRITCTSSTVAGGVHGLQRNSRFVASESSQRPPERSGFLQVPLTAVAIASAILALTCLAVLAVVASIKEVDTLSTVALALAVIAFVAQLIVFVVQTGAANAQLLQSRQLHAELLRLLAEMSERARGTEATVTTMNERLLEAALGKALGTGGGRGSQAQVIASEVASLLDIPSRRVEGSDRLRAARVEDDLMPVVDQEARDRARQVLMTFPEGPVDEAIGALDQLSPEGRSELAAYGEDELWWSGTSIGPGQIPQHAGKELIDAGLLVPRQQGSQMHVLSDVGREAARLLIAEGKPPAHLADAVSRLRASLRQGDTPE